MNQSAPAYLLEHLEKRQLVTKFSFCVLESPSTPLPASVVPLQLRNLQLLITSEVPSSDEQASR